MDIFIDQTGDDLTVTLVGGDTSVVHEMSPREIAFMGDCIRMAVDQAIIYIHFDRVSKETQNGLEGKGKGLGPRESGVSVN